MWTGAVAVALVVAMSSAQAGAAEAQTPEPVPAAKAPIVLVQRGDDLPSEELRKALSNELGGDVRLETEVGAESNAKPRGVVTVTYRKDARELAITWDSEGRTVSRLVSAANTPEQVIEDCALLAGNLAREQVVSVTAEPPQTPPPAPSANAPSPQPVTNQKARAERAPAEPVRLLGTASLFFPLATHYATPDATTNFDLSLLYGRVGAVEGLEVGVVNIVARPRDAHVEGLQLGGVANVLSGELRGVQVASLLNVASRDAQGAQLAFGSNLTFGGVSGLQASLLFNRSHALTGAQLGALNIAHDVDGLQIGIVNVARTLRGVSVGLVNVADDVEGVPIAPFSVTRSGGVHPLIWSGTSGYGNAGLKFATRRTYTLFFGSMHRDLGHDLLGGGVAIGGRMGLGGNFHTDVDIGVTWLVAPSLSHDAETADAYHEQLLVPRVRMLLAFRALPHLGAFLGVSATGVLRSELDWDRVTLRLGPELMGGIEL